MWRHTRTILSNSKWYRRKGSRLNPVTGSVATVAAVTLFVTEKKMLEDHTTSQSREEDHSGNMWSSNTVACQSLMLSDNDGSSSSDFSKKGGGFFMRKHGTIEILKARAEKESSLSSKYNVQWEQPLGEGTFGKVFLATDRSTGQRFALKKIDKLFTDHEAFQREMDALLRVQDAGGHPHICSMREHFDDGKFYHMVLDLITGGEMFDHLAHEGAYSEADAARLLREVTSALAFLHGIGIVHTDLKPENLMLSSKSTDEAAIKVVDFGCAHGLDHESHTHSPRGTAATPAYCPPEVLLSMKDSKDNEHPDIRASFDMWSLGVIAYIMLVGRHPFDLGGYSTVEQMEQKIMSGEKPPLRDSKYTDHLSDDAVDVLEKLIVWDPARRFSADQLLDHPWIRGETASSKKIADSDRRLSIYREHEHSVMRSFFKGLLNQSDTSASKTQNRHDTTSSKMSLLETAFRNLDPNQRGYISTKELQGDTSMFGSDAKLSMSEVSELLSERMANRYFPKNSLVYNQGEAGDCMYFLNSGSIEMTSSDGFSKHRHAGEFFGEEAMLAPNHKRTYSVHSTTPVHAIEITRQDYEEYLVDDPEVQMIIAETVRSRKRENTKTILGLQKTMEPKVYKKDDVIFSAGDKGNVLYILERGDVDIFVNGHKVRSLRPGEMTGEHAAFYFDKPYNVTAVCKSDKCTMQTIKDIHKVWTENPSLRESFRHIILYRDFKKALVAAIDKPFPTTDAELRAAFDALDVDEAGFVSFDKLRDVVRSFDSHYSEEDIEEMLHTLDLNKSGSLTWAAFHQMYCNDKDM